MCYSKGPNVTKTSSASYSGEYIENSGIFQYRLVFIN